MPAAIPHSSLPGKGWEQRAHPMQTPPQHYGELPLHEDKTQWDEGI